MALELLVHTKRIIKTRDHNLAQHLWLQGFDIINNNSTLDKSLINCYLELKLSQHQIFTHLTSGSFLSSQKNLIEKNRLNIIHLPISNDYHLLFALEENYDKEKLVYTECKGRCRVIHPYKFPYIELRRSLDFSKKKETMETIEKGMFYYDNVISIKHQTPDEIIEVYKAMTEFIRETRIN